MHRPVSASNTGGNTTGSIPARIRWKPYNLLGYQLFITTAIFDPTLEPIDVNAVELASDGTRPTQAYKVEGLVNSDCKLLSQGTTIGTRQVALLEAGVQTQ